MLTVALALCVAQFPQHRIHRQPNLPQSSLALFEFAPASGAGMTAECVTPNWVTHSEQFDNAAWLDDGLATTQTANYGTAPDGTATADRLQTQVVTGAERSTIYQTGCPITGGAVTASVWARATSGTASLDLCHNGGAAACRARKTLTETWERVEVTFNTLTNGNIIIGTHGVYNGGIGAQDMLIWGAMCNVGSSAASYIATTSAASAGPLPTGAKGEALTFTRTGNAVCTRGTNGLRTTGIANGDLVLQPGNTARVMSDSDGVKGLLVEGVRTNLVLRSQEIDNAAWTKASGGVAAPTVTANYATAPDGTTTAERVQVAACPTGGQYSVVYQIALTAGASAGSVYCRGTSASQTISVCVQGTSGAACTPVTCSASSWYRFTTTTTTTGTGGLVIGCDNEPAYAGSSNTGAADVLLWGAQFEVGSGVTYATSYNPTTSASATRNVELATVTLPVSLASGSTFSVGASFVTPATQANTQIVVGLGDSASDATPQALIYTTAGQITGYSVNPGTLTLSGVAAAAGAHRTSYSSERRIYLDATTVTNTATTTNAAGTIVSIGANGAGGTIAPDSILTRICVDPSPTRCR